MFAAFIAFVYFIAGCQCCLLKDAPFLTLRLYKDVELWRSVDSESEQATSRKLDLHTDYLNGRNVVLCLASDKVSDQIKKKMATT